MQTSLGYLVKSALTIKTDTLGFMSIWKQIKIKSALFWMADSTTSG